MPLGPGLVVDAPVVGAPPMSLLTAAEVVEHTNDDRWIGGVQFAPERCEDAFVFDPCDSSFEFDEEDRGAIGDYTPFGVGTTDVCSAFGDRTDREAKALTALLAHEAKAVEAEFWTAAIIAANPHLAAGGDVTTIATAQSLRLGLALLDQHKAETNGGRGMIHARPLLVDLWYGLDLLRWESGKLYTAKGTIVVGGDGYPGTGPTGQAIGGGTEWAFVTDLVTVHRGPVEFFGSNEPLTSAAVDHVNNTVRVRAQRAYAPLFNGCTLGAVSITVPVTGL